MKNLVLIGGGKLTENIKINKHIIELTDKKNPQILYFATASKNDFKNIELFKEYFCDYDVQIADGNYEEKIKKADIIYIGGGNTSFLIEELKKENLIEVLINALDEKVVVGVSAGAIFWFNKYLSDSEMFNLGLGNFNLNMKEGINYFNIACCPHYDLDGRDVFSEYISSEMMGIALENNVAIVIRSNEMYVIKEKKSKCAYSFLNGKIQEIKENNYSMIFEKIVSNINGKKA